MAKVKVLVEVEESQPEAFAVSASLMESEDDAVRHGEKLLAKLAKLGLEVLDDVAPVPMFAPEVVAGAEDEEGFAAFAAEVESDDAPSATTVVSCEVDRSKLDKLAAQPGVTVWPNSEMAFFPDEHPFDLARSSGGLDCRPYLAPSTIAQIRTMLGVEAVWNDGFRGQNVIVGVIDQGIDGTVYPVVGGFARAGSRQPGTASIQTHGSMSAANVLVAAPAARLYDYPFLGLPSSGGALQMFQAILDQRRRDGTPHVTNSSYGFTFVPPQSSQPNHEAWNVDHPVNRKVREVVASGATAFFAAGNCGSDCPAQGCHASAIGPGKSIVASNSLAEVITVAAVNRHHQRLGYSAQGPGRFAEEKPDVAAYSHVYANFGPGRPAGGDESRFDSGTSTACPIAAGVAALLLSAVPDLTPEQVRTALIAGAIDLGQPGWDAETGHGVINAAASYNLMRS